ncbi:uncharacterized protein SPSK_00067 [Sporothrix schenckii 1099-18]|uniref:Uncharacterized protein n=1 Tax=Sporothrix schenckii 1099-18 TaxID=1397361 RepID=A0A0F2LQK3_SPOSC|nr:uncharacterized protein SPSK_00067 [Sporothrix schenckii 1099-18]KJR79807.1 hypothetical protein SPSK_00067 [Sporothrix schenckii 1099-18]
MLREIDRCRQPLSTTTQLHSERTWRRWAPAIGGGAVVARPAGWKQRRMSHGGRTFGTVKWSGMLLQRTLCTKIQFPRASQYLHKKWSLGD